MKSAIRDLVVGTVAALVVAGIGFYVTFGLFPGAC